jgi:hypothetical protein
MYLNLIFLHLTRKYRLIAIDLECLREIYARTVSNELLLPGVQ